MVISSCYGARKLELGKELIGIEYNMNYYKVLRLERRLCSPSHADLHVCNHMHGFLYLIRQNYVNTSQALPGPQKWYGDHSLAQRE
jgi:hypothetical protein